MLLLGKGVSVESRVCLVGGARQTCHQEEPWCYHGNQWTPSDYVKSWNPWFSSRTFHTDLAALGAALPSSCDKGRFPKGNNYSSRGQIAVLVTGKYSSTFLHIGPKSQETEGQKQPSRSRPLHCRVLELEGAWLDCRRPGEDGSTVPT